MKERIIKWKLRNEGNIFFSTDTLLYEWLLSFLFIFLFTQRNMEGFSYYVTFSTHCMQDVWVLYHSLLNWSQGPGKRWMCRHWFSMYFWRTAFSDSMQEACYLFCFSTWAINWINLVMEISFLWSQITALLKVAFTKWFFLTWTKKISGKRQKDWTILWYILLCQWKVYKLFSGVCYFCFLLEKEYLNSSDAF